MRVYTGIDPVSKKKPFLVETVPAGPSAQAAKPTVPQSDPQPPTGHEAARIVVEAWKDPDWGMLMWLAMVTGARRGELCALR